MKLQSIAKLLSNRINQEHYVLHYLHQVYNAGVKKGKNLPPPAVKKSEEDIPDLKTLEYVRNQFKFHSDSSVFCNGYRWLERKIEELQNQKK